MRQPVRNDLIFDIGASEGNDTQFYLRKGFTVLTLEADPIMFEQLKIRFSAEIAAGRLRLMHRAAHETTGQRLSFYRNETHQALSSVAVNELSGQGGQTTQHEVETISWPTLIKYLGVPYYCKIDIENNEARFLQSFTESDGLPTYISVEAHSFAPIEMLFTFGYRYFKLVNQNMLWTFEMPNPPLEGLYVPDPDWTHGSGPFGRELMGEWASFQETAVMYDMIQKLYSRRTILHTWFDCHAWMP